MFWNRFKLMLSNNWLMLSIIFGGGLLLLLTVIGFASMESFYAQMMIAQLPFQILMVVIQAVIFAYLIIKIQTGTLTKTHIPQIKSDGIGVTFKDVIGLEESKREAMEVVELIRDRKRVQKIGGKIIRGILMVGPPGCGKTLLAKAIAKESNIPFIAMAGSEFTEIFVGMGAGRIRKLFSKARQLAQAYGACIIFIDELDVIGRGRNWSFMGGGEETNSTQNQLLVEMDGLKEKPANVIVIGATNAEESILDKALLRPGRFDRKIFIGLPNLEDREALFRYYLSKVQSDPAVDVGRLSRKSIAKSPADIENIVKEAALIATRDKRDIVEFKDLSSAIERIELGVKHKHKMSDEERAKTAYHESGHLVVLYLLHPTDDVFKASIIHRGGVLGVVHPQPREELFTENRDKLLADIKVYLAGYVAEKIRYGATTSGVAADFRGAMQIAHTMVWRLGMGTNGFLGDYTAVPESQRSHALADKLNVETQMILQACQKDVESLLKREWNVLERFVQELLKKDELEYDEIEAIFNEFGKSNPNKPVIPKNDSIETKIDPAAGA